MPGPLLQTVSIVSIFGDVFGLAIWKFSQICITELEGSTSFSRVSKCSGCAAKSLVTVGVFIKSALKPLLPLLWTSASLTYRATMGSISICTCRACSGVCINYQVNLHSMFLLDSSHRRLRRWSHRNHDRHNAKQRILLSVMPRWLQSEACQGEHEAVEGLGREASQVTTGSRNRTKERDGSPWCLFWVHWLQIWEGCYHDWDSHRSLEFVESTEDCTTMTEFACEKERKATLREARSCRFPALALLRLA